MENQHRLIKGYRDLTQEEIDAMNKYKEQAEIVAGLIREQSIRLEMMPQNSTQECLDKNEARRWLVMAQDKLQLGFMCLIRSLTRPSSF